MDFVITPANKRPVQPWVSKKPVAIAYHFFPHYRRAILERLLLSTTCDFVMAADADGRAIDPSIEKWRAPEQCTLVHLPIFRLPLGLYWQPHLIAFALQSSVQCAVLLGDPNNLATWIAALIFRRRDVRVLFWAHGWIDSKEYRFKRFFRNLFFG